MILLSCKKWQYILRVQGAPLPFWDLLKIYFIGYYFSNLLPTNVGGDVVRAAYVGKKINSTSTAMVSVFLERFTGLILLLLLAFFGPMTVPGLIQQAAVIIPVALAFVLMLVVFAMLAMPNPVGLARKLIPIRLLEPVYKAADAFHQKLREALKSLRANPTAYGPIAGYTLVFYVLALINVYVSFRSFGLEPAFDSVLAITPLVMLISMLPIALGGFGLQEFSYSYYFSLVGIPAASVLAMALLLRFKLVMIAICGMIIHTTYKSDDRAPPTT